MQRRTARAGAEARESRSEAGTAREPRSEARTAGESRTEARATGKSRSEAGTARNTGCRESSNTGTETRSK